MNTLQHHDHHDDRPCSRWCLLLLLLALHVNASEGQKNQLNLVSGATERGAVCLDGTPPGYFLSPGFGRGIRNWMVYFEGGAWCASDSDCARRAKTYLGSTSIYGSRPILPNSGILSDSPRVNPDFYDWNVVWVRYCDGASFLGDRDEPVVISEDLTIYYRGARIWDAIMDDLMEKGMADADKALLTGCSAGGLTTILRCDSFSEIFPSRTSVKCLADAGFFLDVPDISGGQTAANMFRGVALTHNVMGNLNRGCTAFRAPDERWECIFAHNTLPHVQTPMYILQSAMDYWQIQNLVGPKWLDPKGEWATCTRNLYGCNSTQLYMIREFSNRMVRDIGFGYPGARGEFLISCYAHCMATDSARWSSHQTFTIRDMTMQQSIGDWFNERNFYDIVMVDQPFPRNPSCARSTTSEESEFAAHLDILPAFEPV